MKSGIWLWDRNPFLPDFFPKGHQQSRRTGDSSAAKQWVLNLRQPINRSRHTEPPFFLQQAAAPGSALHSESKTHLRFPCLGPETFPPRPGSSPHPRTINPSCTGKGRSKMRPTAHVAGGTDSRGPTAPPRPCGGAGGGRPKSHRANASDSQPRRHLITSHLPAPLTTQPRWSRARRPPSAPGPSSPYVNISPSSVTYPAPLLQKRQRPQPTGARCSSYRLAWSPSACAFPPAWLT